MQECIDKMYIRKKYSSHSCEIYIRMLLNLSIEKAIFRMYFELLQIYVIMCIETSVNFQISLQQRYG